MAQHRRRNCAAEGSDGMGPAELHAETSLEIVGQEIVPLAATPGEFLSAAGAISQTPPERTELVLAASQSSLTRPMASDAGRSQRNGMEGQLVVANPVLNIGIATRNRCSRHQLDNQLALVLLLIRWQFRMQRPEFQMVLKWKVFCLRLMISSYDDC